MKRFLAVMLTLCLLAACACLANAESTLPNIIKADSAEQFYGHWVAGDCTAMGMTLNAKQLGLRLDLDISEGKAVITDDEGSASALCTFADGQMTVIDGGQSIVINLCDDGRLTLSIDSDGTTVAVYFDKE